MLIADSGRLPPKPLHLCDQLGGELKVISEHRVAGSLTSDHVPPGAAESHKRRRTMAPGFGPDGEVGGIIDHGDDFTQPALELSPGLSGTPVEVEIIDVGHMRPSQPRQRH